MCARCGRSIYHEPNVLTNHPGRWHPPPVRPHHRHRRRRPPPEHLRGVPGHQRPAPQGLQGAPDPVPQEEQQAQEGRLLQGGAQGRLRRRPRRRRRIPHRPRRHHHQGHQEVRVPRRHRGWCLPQAAQRARQQAQPGCPREARPRGRRGRGRQEEISGERQRALACCLETSWCSGGLSKGYLPQQMVLCLWSLGWSLGFCVVRVALQLLNRQGGLVMIQKAQQSSFETLDP